MNLEKIVKSIAFGLGYFVFYVAATYLFGLAGYFIWNIALVPTYILNQGFYAGFFRLFCCLAGWIGITNGINKANEVS